MEMSAEIDKLAAALSKAQGTMKAAAKDAVNPHFKSHYSTLASVWEAARSPLSGNGLSLSQGAHATDQLVSVTTLLMHTSGQWLRDTLTMVARDASPQSIGSAISYGRRYGLSAMVGVAPDDDDDGEAAQPQSNGQQRDYSRPQSSGSAKPQAAVANAFIDWKQQKQLIEAAKTAGWTDAALATFAKDNYGSWAKVPLSEFEKVMAAMQGGTEPIGGNPADIDIDAKDIPF
jgi:hypothetical protein